jgi:hypothetical protein
MLVGYNIDYVQNLLSYFFETCKYDFDFFLTTESTGAQESKTLSVKSVGDILNYALYSYISGSVYPAETEQMVHG